MLHKCRTLSKLSVRHSHFCLQLPEPNQWGLSYNGHPGSALHVGQLLIIGILECHSKEVRDVLL